MLVQVDQGQVAQGGGEAALGTDGPGQPDALLQQIARQAGLPQGPVTHPQAVQFRRDPGGVVLPPPEVQAPAQRIAGLLVLAVLEEEDGQPVQRRHHVRALVAGGRADRAGQPPAAFAW